MLSMRAGVRFVSVCVILARVKLMGFLLFFVFVFAAGLPQNIISRQAAPPGQHDVLSFHVYNQQAPGTVAFWVVTAGGSGPHDPPRTEVVAAQSPVRPGWRHTDTFYAYPRAVARSLTSVHVFDAEYPRRFGYSLDGIQLTKQGWRKVFSFDAPNTPLPGTFQIFVATTGKFLP